jgi:hypothetical protein
VQSRQLGLDFFQIAGQLVFRFAEWGLVFHGVLLL